MNASLHATPSTPISLRDRAALVLLRLWSRAGSIAGQQGNLIVIVNHDSTRRSYRWNGVVWA